MKTKLLLYGFIEYSLKQNDLADNFEITAYTAHYIEKKENMPAVLFQATILAKVT